MDLCVSVLLSGFGGDSEIDEVVGRGANWVPEGVTTIRGDSDTSSAVSVLDGRVVTGSGSCTETGRVGVGSGTTAGNVAAAIELLGTLVHLKP
jgi:hypothetical protein